MPKDAEGAFGPELVLSEVKFGILVIPRVVAVDAGVGNSCWQYEMAELAS